MKSEATYQAHLIRKLEKMFPGCWIVKNDPSINQGVPDLLILFGVQWAMLEVKRSATAPEQPNQRYYVDHFDHMSYAAFIYPEIEDRVLAELQGILGTPAQGVLIS